ERKLAARRPDGSALMDEAALGRFLMHYERLTRWMLQEMPGRADIAIKVGANHRPLGCNRPQGREGTLAPTTSSSSRTRGSLGHWVFAPETRFPLSRA